VETEPIFTFVDFDAAGEPTYLAGIGAAERFFHE